MVLRTYRNKKSAARMAALYVERGMKKGSALLLISGGSALDILKYINPNKITKYTTIGFVDERHTNVKTGCNFTGFMKSKLYKVALMKNAKILDSRKKRFESVYAHGERLQGYFLRWRKNYPNAKIVAIFGIGTDGHTAGIFPDLNRTRFKKRFMGKKYYIGYKSDKNNSKFKRRITGTLKLVISIDKLAIYSVGQNKKDCVLGTLLSEDQINIHPSRILHKAKESTLFTDIKF